MTNRYLIQFLVSRFFSSLGDQFLLFAVPLLVYKATGNIAMSGFAFLIEWLPRIISLPIAGALSDKLGGRKVYLLADCTRSISCILAFTLLLIMPKHAFYIISLLMGVCAFFYAQSFIALETTIPKIVKPEAFVKAQSIVQGVEQCTVILGPILASFAVIFFPLSYLIIITALIFALSFFGILFLRGLPVVQSINQINIRNKNIIYDMKQGITILFSEPKLIWLVALAIAVNLIWGLAVASNAAIVTGIFHHSASMYGLLQTTAGILGVLTFFIIPLLMRYCSVYMMGICAYLFMVLGGILIGLSSLFAVFFVGYVLVTAFDGVFNVYIRSERVKIIPKEHLGKTIGIIVLINQLSLPVAGLFLAIFSASFGVKNLFMSVSVFSMFLLILFLLGQYAVKYKSALISSVEG